MTEKAKARKWRNRAFSVRVDKRENCQMAIIRVKELSMIGNSRTQNYLPC